MENYLNIIFKNYYKIRPKNLIIFLNLKKFTSNSIIFLNLKKFLLEKFNYFRKKN